MFQISLSLCTVLLAVSALARPDVDLNILQEENRLLAGLDNAQEKAIQYKSAGDYTLVNIPWSGATSLAFNDSTAATISTLGNAALLVGGLYLLSGFPSALARSDPFGVQRRFGAPAPPAKMFKPRGETEQEKKRGRKKTGGRHQRQRGVERRGPGGVRQGPEERTLPQFSLPETERQLRQPQFNLPQFRPFQLRMPSLPNLRLPSFPGLGRRPPAQNRPRPAPQQTSQAAPPAPAPQSARPAPQSARPAPQSARPAPQSSRPAPQSSRPAPASQSPRPVPQSSRPAPRPQSSRPAPPVQAARPPVIPPVQEQSAPLTLPNPRPAGPSDFGGAFDTDPFQEFQSADFGNDQSFQALIAEQFGESFDFKKIK